MYDDPTPAETDFPETIDGIPLLTMDESGDVPEARLSKSSSLRSIFKRLRDDDDSRAQNRAMIQELRDGAPPHDDKELEDAGQADTTNLNFDGAEQQAERAKAPYYKLIQSAEKLMTAPTTYGPEEDRNEFSDVLAEEITRTIRNQPQFTFQAEQLVDKFVWDGVGIGHWPDEMDWRWRSSGLGKFYFPVSATPCEDDLEIACCVEEYTVTRLYHIIRDPEKARTDGWCVEAVEKAIRDATTNVDGFNDWEKLIEEIKNNDLGVSNRTPMVRLVNGWVKEFDGSVSHYLTTEDDQGTEKFIYCGRQKYKSMSEAFVIFPYGIGTNTKLHGIRGLGKKIYSFEQQRNRSLGRMIDIGNLSSALMLQPQDEESLANVGMQFFGNTAVIDPNVKVVQYTAPDLQRSVMPVLQEMERLRNDRVAGYSSDNVFDGDQRKTKGEVMAHLEQSAQLSDSALDLFYGPFERLLRQTVRRMIRRTYVPQDPGGREIQEMHLRLVKRGVPLEALYQIDVKAIRVVRAIGAGSAAAKTISLQRISDLRPRMDDVAQATLDRELAVDAVGYAQADIFFPRNKEKRTTADTNIATLENFVLQSGKEIPVLPSDRHLAHAREHIKPLMEDFDLVQQGQMTFSDMAQQDRLLYQHAAGHVDLVAGDPVAVDEASSLRQMLQQIGEVIENGIREMEAAAKKQQAEGGPPEGEAPAEQMPAKDIADFERHKIKMQQSQELFELEKQQAMEMAATKRAIADADGAARIARGR